ncbi:hypothetical protein [Weissella bombi]|uniref:Uncharacterized protein n=1 Tax=Weissella bombi TaxID=1505725 RepID=A0A1C4C4U3_9LACO|nr:hypothetical protein [Weissella bombi]SCC14034.1 hypothetical protein GA0061074_1226 [Weissella bombi]
MIIFGIIGFIALFFIILEGLWALIPWLILAVIITSIIGFFLDHFIIAILAMLVILIIAGYFIKKKEHK